MLIPLLILLLIKLLDVDAFYEPDRITTLPGLVSQINFQHFAGFLNASGRHQLFYVFATSQNKPATDPLVLWLNGGPGCSSLTGLFLEHGPYFVNEDGRTLRLNPHSWNANASMLYVEAPIGTGFSKTLDDNEELMSWGDDATILDIYTAVKFFLNIKFPSFRQNKFFISGESYAGTYLPLLSQSILDGMANFHINFEGIALGNGCTNTTLEASTLLEYSYAHELIDEQRFERLQQRCNTSDLSECSFDITSAFSINLTGIDTFDIYIDAEDTDGISTISADQNGNALSTSTHFDQSACRNDTNRWAYLNQNIVRKALHIPESVGAIKWEACNDEIGVYYQQSPYASGVENFVRNAVNSGIRVLLFYGDTDSRCNALLGQKFADSLGFPLKQAKTQWFFEGQVGGMKTVYSNGSLIYTSVRGAGHMVPINKGAEIQYALNKFLQNQDF